MAYQNLAPQKPKTMWVWWMLGGIGALIAAVILTWSVTANVNEAAKVDKMTAIANGIPSDGWEMVTNVKPRHNVGCIPFDNSCHSLLREWETPGPVALEELVKSTGYDLEIYYRAMPGCAVGWVDRVHLQPCTDDDSVDLRMFDR
jgi:hypothetical protein